MDISKIGEKVSEFLSKNTLEITCVVVSSAVYQIYQHMQAKKVTRDITHDELRPQKIENKFSTYSLNCRTD